MIAAFAVKLAAMPLQMADKIGTFQAAGRIRVSRMTSAPSSDCSDISRFASKTILTASSKFVRASSRVAPYVLAPGSSSTNATYPSGTFM
jgi:hypothetical protein